MTDYVTLRNDGDTKKKVNNITKENYKQLQLIASRREQKKTKKTLSSRSFALTIIIIIIIILSENQRPITCLNNMYKWFTSCPLAPMDQHLDRYGLMEGQQRGAKSGCFNTMDNLLIDSGSNAGLPERQTEFKHGMD